MEIFKIENFIKDHPNKQFPWFNTLSQIESQKIFEKLKQKINIAKKISHKALVKKIHKKGRNINFANAESIEFDFEDLISHLNIKPNIKIYINWYHYDNIDIILFREFCKYFDYIWYPSSDDIDLFDDDLSWVISVSHDGSINFVSL